MSQETYQRNGRLTENDNVTPIDRGAQTKSRNEVEKGGMRVNGFQQVLELLRVADKDFRNSLLMRIHREDPALGQRLHTELTKLGIF